VVGCEGWIEEGERNEEQQQDGSAFGEALYPVRLPVRGGGSSMPHNVMV
jgi:hypothetical protein